jgi:Family of unknown function (DUF6165)
MIVYAPISVGELIDKITILRIKAILIKDESKLKNIDKEMYELETILSELKIDIDLSTLEAQLEAVNLELWHIEDYKRAMEKDQNFGEGFINAARQVYLKNDLRAKIKRNINELVGSDIVEEKSY